MKSLYFIRFITTAFLVFTISPRNSVAGDDASIVVAHDRLNSCWHITPAQVKGPVVITIRFSLNRNGTLKGQPAVISPLKFGWQKKLADEAVKAVERCAPFSIATEDGYRSMKTMTVNFIPSDSNSAPTTDFDAEDVGKILDNLTNHKPSAKQAEPG